MYDIVIICGLIFYQYITYRYSSEEFMLYNKNKYFSIVLIALLPNSIIEEIIFYYIFIYIQKYVSLLCSVIISTMLFTLWHIPLYRVSLAPYKYVTFIMLLGISLRISNIRYNNLISSIISHTIYNFFIILLQYINIKNC